MLASRMQQAAAGIGFDPVGVVFDGTNDYLTHANFTGEANSQQVTISFWIDGSFSNSPMIYYNGPVGSGNRLGIFTNASATLSIVSIPGSTTLDVSAPGLSSSSGWQHVLMSFDLSDTAKRHVYIDDVDRSLTVTTYDTSGNLNFVPSGNGHNVAQRSDGAIKLNGSLAEFWMNPGTYLDLDIEANRRKFITADGTPANLGATGNGPTGSTPLLYLGSAAATAANWNTNRGSGGGMTLNGALGTDATPPDIAS